MQSHLWTDFRSWLCTTRHLTLWLTFGALLIRLPFLWIQSGDYIDYLHPWFEQIKQNGGLRAIGMPIGNYMVSYSYILAILTYLPLPDLISIKLISITGDIVLAWFCMKLAEEAAPHTVNHELIYGIVLFWPTVVLNSSAWGQCDSLYTASLLAFLYFLSKGKSDQSIISLSIAFCLKLQSVFLAPVVLIAICQRIIQIRSLFLFPLIYGLAILPAYCAGRPLAELITLYFHQAFTYSALSMNAPNLYAWLPWQYKNKLLEMIGIGIAFIFVTGLTFLITHYKIKSTRNNLLKLAFLSSLVIPFLLPHMHERYFYLADILSILLVWTKATKNHVILLVPFCSLGLTVRFLFGLLWISPAVLSLLMIVVCWSSFKSLHAQIRQIQVEQTTCPDLKRGDPVEMH